MSCDVQQEVALEVASSTGPEEDKHLCYTCNTTAPSADTDGSEKAGQKKGGAGTVACTVYITVPKKTEKPTTNPSTTIPGSPSGARAVLAVFATAVSCFWQRWCAHKDTLDGLQRSLLACAPASAAVLFRLQSVCASVGRGTTPYSWECVRDAKQNRTSEVLGVRKEALLARGTYCESCDAGCL